MDGASSSSLRTSNDGLNRPPPSGISAKSAASEASAASIASSQISPFTNPPPSNPFDPSLPAKSARLPPSSPSSKPKPRTPFDPSTSTTAPPYWTQSHNRVSSHHSLDSEARGGITLTDNTDGASETSAACWARGVEILSYETVNGAMGGLNVGAFVVYSIRITTLTGSVITLLRRYSDFYLLRQSLTATFPNSAHSIPDLPPKGVFDKFRPSFLEKRRRGLQYFLNCVCLNPEFAGAPVVREWLGLA